MKITSSTNARIKNVVQLRNRKHRAETGLTIVEGHREITRALEAGVMFKEMFICNELIAGSGQDQLIESFPSDIPIYETTETVFSKISYGDRCEGILAVCSPQASTFDNLTSKAQPLYVVVESVEKPGNLGAILRTCDGAGVDGVIICDGKTDIHNPNVIRASLGTVFSVNVVVCSNESAVKFLRSQNVTICATLPKAKTIYTKADLDRSVAIVVGSEQNGLTDYWAEHADLKVRIPMNGYADSLNVSASTAILLYEIIRQRTG